MTLIYINGDKGVVLLLIVNISGCLLLNMALDVSWLVQTTLCTSKIDPLTTVCSKNQAVINVRLGQINTMLMLNLALMGDLYPNALYPQNCGNDDEKKQHNQSKSCDYVLKICH